MADKKNAARDGADDDGQGRGTTSVHDLIAQREQLRGWIRRLDEVRTEAPDRVAQRVRADYEDRLNRVMESLTGHREEIERGLEQLRGELRDAEGRLTQAVDALDEQRLRHLIGELDEGAWSDLRVGLEAAVANAETELARTREEVERLEVLSADIVGGAEAAAEPEEQPVAAEEEEEDQPAAASDEPAADEAPAFEAPEAEAPFAWGAGEDADATVAWGIDAPPSEDAPAAARDEIRAEAETEEADTAAEPAGASSRDEGVAIPGIDSAAAEEWDPFGNEFGGDGGEGEQTEELPWLAPLEEKAAAPWTPSGGDDDGLEFLNELEKSAAGDADAAGELAPDDLAFLEELDRAISGTTSRASQTPAPAPASAAQTPPPAAAGSPAPARPGQTERLLCKECGALNEPHSWYCEVCGSEL